MANPIDELVSSVKKQTIDTLKKVKSFKRLEWRESKNPKTGRVSEYKKVFEFGGYVAEPVCRLECDGEKYIAKLKYSVTLSKDDGNADVSAGSDGIEF